MEKAGAGFFEGGVKGSVWFRLVPGIFAAPVLGGVSSANETLACSLAGVLNPSGLSEKLTFLRFMYGRSASWMVGVEVFGSAFGMRCKS